MTLDIVLGIISTGILLGGNGVLLKKVIRERQRHREISMSWEQQKLHSSQVLHDLRSAICTLELSANFALEELEKQKVEFDPSELKRAVMLSTQSLGSHLETLTTLNGDRIRIYRPTPRSERPAKISPVSILRDSVIETAPQARAYGREVKVLGLDAFPFEGGVRDVRGVGYEKTEDALHRIVGNLLINAMEHSGGAADPIEVSTEIITVQGETFFKLNVSNPVNGESIQSQVSCSAHAPNRPRGLGLKICHSLSQEMGFGFRAGMAADSSNRFVAELRVPVALS